MNQRDFGPDRKRCDHGTSPTVVRAPLDTRHFLELTFRDSADTQYRIVTLDFDHPYPTINEARHRTMSEVAFGIMMESFHKYERAIAILYSSGDNNDGVTMRKLRDAYQQAVDKWYALQ